MPKVEIMAAGKSVTIEADEIAVKELAKLAIKTWNDIEFPKGARIPFGISPPSDQVAPDHYRFEPGHGIEVRGEK